MNNATDSHHNTAKLVGGVVTQNNDFVRVEGAKLYSLLQTSDRPIIHVAMTGSSSTSTATSASQQAMNATSNNSSSGMSISSNISFPMSSNAIAESTADNGDVILAASDTQGVVRIYCPDTIEENTQDTAGTNSKVNFVATALGTSVLSANASTTTGDMNDLQNHAVHNEYRNSMYNVDAINVNMRPLIRVGEYTYQNAVVACCFQNGSFANCTATNVTSTTGNYTSSKTASYDDCTEGYDTLTVDNAFTVMSTAVASKSLLVAVAKGELFMYGTQDWTNFSTIQQLKMSKSPSKSKEILKEMKLKHTASCDFDDLSISTNSSNDNREASDMIRNASVQSPKLQAKLSFCNSVQGGGNTSDSNKYTNINQPYKSIVDNIEQRNKTKLGLHPTTTTIIKKQSSATASTADKEEDSAYMVPRSQPPPMPTPLINSPIMKTTSFIVNKSNTATTTANNNASNNITTNTTSNNINRPTSSSSFTAIKKPQVVTSSTTTTSKDQKHTHIPTSSSITAATITAVAATTTTLKKTLFVNSPAATETTEENDSNNSNNNPSDNIEIYPKTPFPDVLTNELGQPILTNTKIIEQKLHKISKQLDQDEVIRVDYLRYIKLDMILYNICLLLYDRSQ